MTAQGISPSHEAKIRALRAKHSQISDQIEEVQKSPGAADYYLKQLKRQKLVLKDTIEQMGKVSANN